ncbi:MAG: hypothetical protein V9H26_12975 [Verrucomicrobiota bacterium]
MIGLLCTSPTVEETVMVNTFEKASTHPASQRERKYCVPGNKTIDSVSLDAPATEVQFMLSEDCCH